MNRRGVFLGSLAYLVVTIPLAVVRHVVLFEPFYLFRQGVREGVQFGI